jgi:hypothetical protein
VCRAREVAGPVDRAELARLLRAAATGAVQQAHRAPLAPRARVLRHRAAPEGASEHDLAEQFQARWFRILANIGLDAQQQVRAELLSRASAHNPRLPCGAQSQV